MARLGRRYPIQPLWIRPQHAGLATVSAVVAGSLSAIVGVGAGAAKVQATAAGSLSALVGSGTAVGRPHAVVAGSLSPIVGSGTAAATVHAVAAGSLSAIVGSGTASAIVHGVVAGALAPLLGAGTAKVRGEAVVAGSLSAIVGAGTAKLLERAVVAGSLSAVVGTGTAIQISTGTDIHGSLSPIVGSGTATLRARAIVAGSLSRIQGAGTARSTDRAAMAGMLRPIVGHGTARGPVAEVVLLDRPVSIRFARHAGGLEFASPGATRIIFLSTLGGRVKGPLEFKTGELFPIRFTLTDDDGNPEDLTGVDTLTWTVRRLHEPPLINKAPLTRVAPYDEGVVEYVPTAGELTERGKFLAEVDALFTDGRRRRYPSPRGYAEIIISDALTVGLASVGASLAAIGAP